jgi:hypothetical protein
LPSKLSIKSKTIQGDNGEAISSKERMRRNTKVIELLETWLKDESGYDEETFPALKKALEKRRKAISARPLFDE